jgi:hypothetical protein
MGSESSSCMRRAIMVVVVVMVGGKGGKDEANGKWPSFILFSFWSREEEEKEQVTKPRVPGYNSIQLGFS